MDRLRDSVIYFYGHKLNATSILKNGVIKTGKAMEQSSDDKPNKLTSNPYEKNIDSYADNLVQTIVNEVMEFSLSNTGKLECILNSILPKI